MGCGYARLWGFLPSGLGVGYSSPQVPRHPTSMCNFGVNEKKIKVRDWSKSIGGGWAGAFGNVVDKKHMAHPLPSAQK